MTLTSQASFPSEFGQLCSHILDIKGTCRTLSLRRQPPRQFKKHLSAFYGHLLQDGGDSADAGSHAATRSDDWTSLLSERVAAKLYDLRVDRRFDDCNALSALLEALGVDCGAGIPGDLGRDVVEIERDGVTDVVAWEHPRSILWLLFSLAGPLDAERKAADSASKHAAKIIAAAACARTPPGREAAMVTPNIGSLRSTDSAQMLPLLSARYPFHVVWPESVFEEEPVPFGPTTIAVPDSLQASSVFLGGKPRTSKYDAYKTRTLFGALSNPSANITTNVWSLDVDLSLPLLPDRAESFGQKDGPQTVTTQQQTPEDQIDADLAATQLDIWVQSSRSNLNTMMSPLRSWEILEREVDQPMSLERAPSPYLSESPIFLFDFIYRKHVQYGVVERLPHRSEQDENLLQDILSLILGLPSDTFAYVSDTLDFRISSGGLEQSRLMSCGARSFQDYITKFITMGTLLHRLVCVAAQCREPTCGQTTVAFGHALSSYLVYLRACLATIRDTLDRRRPFSYQLQHIAQATHRVHDQLEVIAKICRCNIDSSRHASIDTPTGVNILSRLYNSACAADATTSLRGKLLQATLRALLEHTSRPYMTYLSQLIGLAAPGDANTEHVAQFREFSVPSSGTAGSLDSQSEFPSFLSAATARKVVLAGKYLSVLRQCDENHALVRLQTGSHQRNDGFAGVSLVWVFRQEELTMYRDATDVYIRSVETLVSVDKESAAEAIRIEEAEKEVLREAHKEKRLSIVAQRKEDLESRRASVVRQKASAQADIDAFLETRRAEKLETARKAAWAEAKREQAEIAAAEARSVIVEEEKTRMLLEHDAKMRNLDKRAELIEWRRRRLALAPCRQKMWMGEASSDVDVIDQGSADFEIEEQKSDHDDESFADESIDFGHALVEDRGGFEPLLSIPGSYVSDRNGGPSLGDAIDEFGDEADQPYLDSTKVSKDLLQEAQALESHVTSPTDSIIPALTPKTNARIMGELNVPFSGPSIMSFPSRNLKETQASAHTKAATSFLSAAPLFEDLSVPVRLSPFWGPRLSIYPTDELQTQHPINNLTDANVSEEDATGPTPVERVIQIQEESIALPSVLEHPSFISEHQNAEAVPLTSEPYPVKDTLSSIATQPGPFSIVLSIESQLQAGETSVLPLECTLQQLTSATLHHRLSAVTGLISRMTLRALWPGLRRHLAALRRFFLLGDARFLNKTVDALFRSHDGLAMDASGGKAWPPTRADVAETLHGIVRDEAEAPWLEFGGRLGGTDPGDLTAYGSLKLHYRVPEPYDTVVTTETISKYQNCFEYLIAIQRTRSALDRVPRSRWWRGRRSFRRLDRDEELDVFGPRPSHSDWSDHEHHCAEQMYWETRAFVTGLLQYAMDTSVEATWTEFWHTIQRAKESGQDGSERLGLADDQGLDRLCRSHNDMLDSILWRLFLAPPLQPIKALLDGLLQTSLRVARTLNGISDVPAFDPVGALHDFHQNMNQLVRLIGTFEERFVPAEAAVDGGGRQRDRPMAETDSLSTLLDHIDVSGFVERNLVKSAQEVV